MIGHSHAVRTHNRSVWKSVHSVGIIYAHRDHERFEVIFKTFSLHVNGMLLKNWLERRHEFRSTYNTLVGVLQVWNSSRFVFSYTYFKVLLICFVFIVRINLFQYSSSL